jgi:tetratricopeptide (TPR) repeat protein
MPQGKDALDWDPDPVVASIYEEYWGKAIKETEEDKKVVQEVKDNPDIPPDKRTEAIQQTAAKVDARLAQFPKSAHLAAAGAEFSFATGDNQTGIERANRSVALAEASKNPKRLSAALTVRGRGQFGLGDYAAALSDAEAALKANPKNNAAFILKMLTEGRARIGSPDTGIATGQTATGPDSASKPANHSLEDEILTSAERTATKQAALALFKKAVAAGKLGDHARAADLAERAQELVTESSTLQRFITAERTAAAARPIPQHRGNDVTGLDQAADAQKTSRIRGNGVVSGLAHYVGRTASPLWMDFNEVDTSGVSPSSFPKVAALLRDPARRAPVYVRDERSWATPGLQRHLIGRFRIRLEGTFSVDASCRWTFGGSLSAADDIYDFNESDRSFIDEAITTVGRMIPGKPYRIQFRGRKRLSESGPKEKCP